MGHIIDISTNKSYSIFSVYGKQLLKSYIKFYQTGVSEEGNENELGNK